MSIFNYISNTLIQIPEEQVILSLFWIKIFIESLHTMFWYSLFVVMILMGKFPICHIDNH